jgi:uncharacterized repeat protein (TIGR03943 family)
MKKVINFGLLVLLSSYILIRYSEGTLDYYINKRYEFFTFLAALLTLIVSLAGTIYYFIKVFKDKEFKPLLDKIKLLIKDPKFIVLLILPILALINSLALFLLGIFIVIPWRESYLDKILKNNFLGILSFGFILIIAIAIPAKALGTETVSRRLSDLNNVSLEYEESTLSKFSGNTKNYSIRDWIAAINYNPDLHSYIGKDTKVSGFIFKPENTKQNTFLISRFVVTCCAVDARPVGLYGQYENWEDDFKLDEWVEAEGKFELIQIENKDTLVINIEKITKITQPLDPYIY